MSLMRIFGVACVALALTPLTYAAQTVIVVVGAEGTPEFGEAFNKSADKWAEAAKRGGAEFLLIGRDPLPPKEPATSPATAPATAPASRPAKAPSPCKSPRNCARCSTSTKTKS